MGSCGHLYDRITYDHDLADALEFAETLAGWPCDDCMVHITDVTNIFTDLLEELIDYASK